MVKVVVEVVIDHYLVTRGLYLPNPGPGEGRKTIVSLADIQWFESVA